VPRNQRTDFVRTSDVLDRAAPAKSDVIALAGQQVPPRAGVSGAGTSIATLGVAMPSPTTVRSRSQYIPVARLARGGMAEIVLARLGGTGGFEKLVVLKRLLPHLASKQRLVSMFLHEACVAARISHPNVCQVLELGEAAGHYNIVMEYLEGAIVGQIALALPATRGSFEVRLLAEVFRQLCAGLHHAHDSRTGDGRPAGLVHRDVSPQNLLVTFDGVAKVLDFGIAKSSRSLDQTRAGVALGKAGYMSPEQVRCEPLDRRTDVFSLGVVLHEALTGRLLFHRSTPADTCRAVLAGEVPDVRETQPLVPAGLADAVRAALSPRREDRLATAGELGALVAASVAPLGGPLHTAELAAWMAEVFGASIDERRQRVAEALAGQAQREDDPEPTDVELATLPAVARASGEPDDAAPTTPSRVAPELPAIGLYPGRVLFARPVPIWAPAPAGPDNGLGPDTQDVSRPVPAPRTASGSGCRRALPLTALPLTALPTPAPMSGALVPPTTDELPAPIEPDPLTDADVVLTAPGPRRAALLGAGLVLAVVLGIGLAAASDAPPPPARASAEPARPALPREAVVAPAAAPTAMESTAIAPAAIAPPAAIPPAAASPAVATPAAASPPPVAAPARRTPRRPRATAGTGWITIDSHPYGTVYVDGKRAGLTPLVRAPVAAGAHRVSVKLGDGRTRQLRIVVEAGREAPRRRVDW
jgi:serine/threonine protein kinase